MRLVQFGHCETWKIASCLSLETPKILIQGVWEPLTCVAAVSFPFIEQMRARRRAGEEARLGWAKDWGEVAKGRARRGRRWGGKKYSLTSPLTSPLTPLLIFALTRSFVLFACFFRKRLLKWPEMAFGRVCCYSDSHRYENLLEFR